MTDDQEIRIKCMEIALEHIRSGDGELLFLKPEEVADLIYKWVMGEKPEES